MPAAYSAKSKAALLYYSSYAKEGSVQGIYRVRHFGGRVRERVGIGPWTSCCMNAEEKEGDDDLTAGIAYVDR